MSRQVIPVQMVAEVDRLAADVRAGALATPNVVLALPFNDGRDTTLIVPLDFAMVKANRAAAWAFLKEWMAFRDADMPADQRFDAFERLYRERWAQRSPEAWGLALLFWWDVFRDLLEKPGDPLAVSLAAWLRIPLALVDPTRNRATFSLRIGTRVTVRVDPQWLAEWTYERTVRMAQLEAAVDIGGPALVRMALVVLSMTPVGRAGAIAAFAVDSVVGLLDLLFTIWESERDGEISEQESQDVAWAMAGVVGWWPLQLAIAGVRVSSAVGEMLIGLGEGALQLVREFPDRVAAAQAQYRDYATAHYVDPEGPDTVFVPLDA